jgi:hypothetical protein
MSARTGAKPVAKPAPNSGALGEVFDDLKAILARYASWFAVREGAVKNKRDYHLILQKPLVIDGRKRDELWFASIIQQKDSVGFYFTCMYPDVKGKLSAELLKHLDGKCCFHMKALTPGLKKDVGAALKLGLAEYKKRKWL